MLFLSDSEVDELCRHQREGKLSSITLGSGADSVKRRGAVHDRCRIIRRAVSIRKCPGTDTVDGECTWEPFATKNYLPNWQGIALDRTFWQALGKSLGWRSFYDEEGSPRHEVATLAGW